jgi:hypothetical protein
VGKRYPVHITIRLLSRDLRAYAVLRAVRAVLRALHAVRSDFRIVVFSVQHSHLHLIAEADGPSSFVSGARALCIRIARAFNRVLGRTGRLFADRHYRRILTTPREVRRAMAYVLLNRRRHLAHWGEYPGPEGIDLFSSGGWFDGWTVPMWREPSPRAVALAQTWLARVGWQRHGLISPAEVPG